MGDQDPLDQLTWVTGSPIAEGIALARAEMSPGKCISVTTPNANWNTAPPVSLANLQATIKESCGKQHPCGTLHGKLIAHRNGRESTSMSFTIEFGPLRADDSRVVATQRTVYFDNPQPD